MDAVLNVYFNATDQQFQSIVNSQYKAFVPKWFNHCKSICLFTKDDTALNAAADYKKWIPGKTKAIHTCRFLMRQLLLSKYTVEGNLPEQIFISCIDLPDLNRGIVGYIERYCKIDLHR